MELEKAFLVKQQVFSTLGLSTVRVRSGGPRIFVGIAVPQGPESKDFRIAIRARSEKDLELVFEKGVEKAVRDLTASDIDIEITGPIVAGSPVPVEPLPRRLEIGASVGHYRCEGGTLGFFARRNRDGVVGLVSNNHVLALCDEGVDGDAILHPSLYDQGIYDLDAVGYLDGDYPRLDVEQPMVDCAFAPLREGVTYDATGIAAGLSLRPEMVPPDDQDIVLKKGRTTGLTRGRIKAFSMDLCDIEYAGFGTVFFSQQIEIESIDGVPFSQPGDSGSLIVNPQGNPVGLLAANTLSRRLHYANPIGAVLRALDVTLIA